MAKQVTKDMLIHQIIEVDPGNAAILMASGMHCVWEYPVNDTVLLVSPGIAGWYLPVRNESICSYEVIDLLPQ